MLGFGFTSERDLIGMARAVGAYRRGHFAFKSGLHGEVYINTAYLLAMPGMATTIGRTLGPWASREGIQYDVVVGPTSVQSIVTAAAESMLPINIRSAWLDKRHDSSFGFPRELDVFVRDARVLIVDDMLTAGTTLRLMCSAIEAAGGTVAGAAFVFDRSGGKTAEELGVPWLYAIARIDEQNWESPCPLCRQGVPLSTGLGHPKTT